MVCSAAPLLLLATTLPLLGSPVAQASQPGQSQAGGESGSGQLLDQQNGAGESALVSVYVHLDFSDKTWPHEVSRTLTLPAASASSSPRPLLTGLRLTTECNVNHEGNFYCACLSGYQWNTSICLHYPPCQSPQNHQPCGCLVFSHPEPGYCQLLPPGSPVTCLPAVPGTLSLNSQLQMPGDTLSLTLLLSQEATDLSWFLRHPGSPSPILLQPGTQVSVTSSHGQAALSVSNMSHHWAGEYMSCFEAQGFKWNLHEVVRVPLKATDVARLPDQLSISCATSPGFQLSCCIPSTNLAYTVTWSPGEGSKASSFNESGSQCFVLAVQHCPMTDSVYTCDLQSPGLAPLRVPISITIIQDGDITCPEDTSVLTWNVTKAGHVAQAPCPESKRGIVRRFCAADGVWGPVHSSCTDARLLALFTRAKLLQAGQGSPAEEVPQILSQLPGQAAEASSPSDLLTLLSTMKYLAKAVAKARIQLDCSALKNLLIATDKVLDMDTRSLWTLAQARKPWAGSTLLLAVETLACSLCPQDHPFTFSLPNVLLQSQLFGPTFPADYSISFPTRPPLQAQIPRHSLAPLVRNGTEISITSLVLQKLDHLLPSNYGQGLGDSLYATPGLVLVISIMAGDQAFSQGEVIMDFGNTDGSPHCVFWDHSLFQGRGGWSKEGCQAQAASGSPTARCLCQHLTAFSVLMSPHTVPEEPALALLTQVGLGASILALLVCLGVYRLVWRVVVRNKVSYFRHAALLNMVLCLLAADTCFLGAPFLPPGPRSPLCLAATFLCHFLYLATFFWMLAQALVLAHQLLFVFHQLPKHRVLPLMVLLGYLCPLGLAGVTLGLYLPQGQYLREGECWLDGKGGALYTFVGPVLAIVGVNGLVLAMAMLKLLRPSLSEGPPAEKRQALLGVIKALLILTPIFGLTWGLGLATLLEEVSVVPHYIFTILNTLQGVFILLFGCLMDKKVQEALRKRFCRAQAPSSTISLVSCWLQILSSPSESMSEGIPRPSSEDMGTARS
uniref:adhesion G-protein coupled receptor F3 isoform X1 n=1 Tax=Macaca mulatta TaxID=9544 RepID=UPI0010A22BF2|nr:adhesion G-protein coupled receptor F3 isoform X1 [Macaca mulatta]XP_014967359.2 adhesion G-protein coupled receptor F3 isoform X1 [Macaca mulatta]XP_028687705.1 adhesion G-protein coupled receptor F3 isoform X1 [Macaca mulatta]XP_028687706.1 adhesion G-protein coupled receptor F3 isoform X1 [Macaca mulatta]XP_028687707.1 adhesion G-protein coupled receptor F3 isoform X1 [Macaca mulatta]XP_028687708.1 adhesion G-protein coupled receptor F3 isoform X1 [Macaca mulatta]XP_028687709.1 adhesion